MEAIKTSVISGKGISFIPEMSIKRELKDGLLKSIEIEDVDFIAHYYLNHLKEHKICTQEIEFEKFIMSSKRGFC
jgi:DNA-binding transcriptional LysR family regulator